MADPQSLLSHLPRGAAVVLRHKNAKILTALANRIVPNAHQLGLKVLVAGDVRMAINVGADGVHLSEGNTRRGPLRISSRKPGFIITCAAHSHRALWRAKLANVDVAMVSPIYPTKSHLEAQTLGALRALRLMKSSPQITGALGGLSTKTIKRLNHRAVFGLGAIEAWRS